MVSIENLDFAYEKKRSILENINLSLKAGHIYGLLGENGAGKTTLLKAMAGLVFPKSGTVNSLGFVPKKRQAAFLADLFFIPEEFTLPSLKIAKYLSIYGAFYPKFSEELFYRLLTDFKIDADADLDALSYGQKKKVFISFGLATQTSLLLMDEPTNGLDIPSKSQFRKIIAAELSDERCFIISTHQVRDLNNLIDELIIMSDKSIALAAPVEQITEKMAFKVCDDLPDNALYQEQTLHGYECIVPNSSNEDTQLDIELFFNAVLHKKQEINQRLTQTPMENEQF